jgi:hypothetical protein
VIFSKHRGILKASIFTEMAAAALNSIHYWCHECSSEVSATEQPEGFQCGQCSGIFVEVMEEGDSRLASSASSSAPSTVSSNASSTISSTSSSASASPAPPPPSISFAGPNGIQLNFHSFNQHPAYENPSFGKYVDVFCFHSKFDFIYENLFHFYVS